MVDVMAGDLAEKKSEVEMCWDYEMDGKLVYHSSAYSADEHHDPLWRVTVEFMPSGRKQLTDEGCRRLVESLASAQKSGSR
jgi:hypothetical protein